MQFFTTSFLSLLRTIGSKCDSSPTNAVATSTSKTTVLTCRSSLVRCYSDGRGSRILTTVLRSSSPWMAYFRQITWFVCYWWCLLCSSNDNINDCSTSTSILVINAFRITTHRSTHYPQLHHRITAYSNIGRNRRIDAMTHPALRAPPKSYSSNFVSFATPSIIPRRMVNFGPYGDFLNSKVNDDDNENSHDSNRRKEAKHDPTAKSTNPLYTSKNSNSNYYSMRTNNDHVIFAHGSNADANEHDTARIDNFYYYSSGHSDSWTSDNDTPSITTTITSANTDQSTNDATFTTTSSSRWKREIPSLSSSPFLSSLDQIDMDVAAGTYRILQIPTRTLKPGGLRLFLIMYVLGAIPPLFTPNVAQPLTIWKVDRPSKEEYIIDLYYHDHSAILSIELISATEVVDDATKDDTTIPNHDADQHHTSDKNRNNTNGMIYIHRIGSAPSVMYRLHEATLLQGLVQELLTCATDAVAIPQVQDRLLTFHTNNTTIAQLHSICRTLPFG